MIYYKKLKTGWVIHFAHCCVVLIMQTLNYTIQWQPLFTHLWPHSQCWSTETSKFSRAVEIPCPTCTTWSHFIQDKSKFLFTCPWMSTMYKVNTILCFLFWLIITSSHLALKTVWILISWLLQKPADLDLHCFQEKPADQDQYCLQELIYIWYHTIFERKICLSTVRYKLICSFGQEKFSMDKYILAFLLAPGQVENFTISTPLI